ncbi:MAG TPA: geranylgeranylglycerol-phosphate geranylgeranyltransferase [Chitinophagaceae bacterium]|nr:geranylgeranylglycerol-phosphate geranylgeranyltransferase [Chitinophagaceae bacterium]
MKLAVAFFRLIRYPNLFFIALTQSLFYFCIIVPSFQSVGIANPLGKEGLLYIIGASIFIAAAGYIINDYFDLNIDRINRPEKLVVDNLIKRRWAILWHLGLSFIGIVLSVIVSYKLTNPVPALFNLVTVLLLWFYSTTFKKQVLVGNIIISLLTGWVVLVLYVAISPVALRPADSTSFKVITRIYKFAVLYGGFAFIISLVREVIKDMEDMQGDAKYDCRTMPIVWGLPSSKMFVAVWMIVLICSMVILQVYAMQLRWWWSVGYSILFIITPLVIILRRLFPALAPSQFHELSTLIKIVMLTGILSMLFIKWYS